MFRARHVADGSALFQGAQNQTAVTLSEVSSVVCRLPCHSANTKGSSAHPDSRSDLSNRYYLGEMTGFAQCASQTARHAIASGRVVHLSVSCTHPGVRLARSKLKGRWKFQAAKRTPITRASHDLCYGNGSLDQVEQQVNFPPIS